MIYSVIYLKLINTAGDVYSFYSDPFVGGCNYFNLEISNINFILLVFVIPIPEFV